MKSRSLIDKIIFGGIIVLLVFAPLAFGSVHVWAYSVIEVGVFLLLALWFGDRLIVSGSENIVLNPEAWKDAFESVWEIYPQDRVVFNMVPAENKELKSLVLQELAKRNQ